MQVADALTTAASLVVAYFAWDLFRVKTGIPNPIPLNRYTPWIILLLSIAWVILFAVQQAYSYRRLISLPREISITARTTVGGIIILMTANFLLRFGHLPRTYVALFAVISFTCLLAEKTVLFNVAKIWRKRGKNRRRVLIVGTGKEASTLLDNVEKDIGSGIEILGTVHTDKNGPQSEDKDERSLGDADDIESILHGEIVDEVVICNSDGNLGKVKDILECCGREGIPVSLYWSFLSRYAKRMKVHNLYGINIVSFINVPDSEIAIYAKRILDLIVSGSSLALLSPLFLIISLLIKITSSGPVLYRWNVVGLNKKPFRSWKFRTMVPDADELKRHLMDKNEMNGPVFKIKDDPRITKVGKILRKFSLDELPQLWSVFKGDMSLVGPRPAGPHELARYESWHRKKLSIKPGLTCLWQVSGRSQIRDFDEWVKLDLAYIENWSLWLDLQILLKTIPAVLRGTGV
jgi:exopolysaccharide biosynthesis polyprenyl glycosylphosphotransferase